MRRRTSDTARESKTSRRAAYRSCGDRCLIQPTAVPLPAIRTESRASAARVDGRLWRASRSPGMRAVAVVVALEIEELPLQIGGRSEHGAIQTFAPNGAD